MQRYWVDYEGPLRRWRAAEREVQRKRARDPLRGDELERERRRQRELERERDLELRQREAKRLIRRLRKQLALLKNVITRDILLTKNLHSLCEHLRFNLGDRSDC
jgi:hypothetical protein